MAGPSCPPIPPLPAGVGEEENLVIDHVHLTLVSFLELPHYVPLSLIVLLKYTFVVDGCDFGYMGF